MLLPIFLLLTRFNLLSCSSSPFDLRFIKHNEGPIIIGSKFEEFRAIGVKREFIELAAMEVETVGKTDTSISGKTDTSVCGKTDSCKESKTVASIPQATNIMHPSKPAPIKRARSSSEVFVLGPNVSAAKIIEYELGTCNCRKEKRERLLQALELIAANDIDAFLQVEEDLLKAFKVRNVGYIVKGESKNYLLKMMILFGADKFISRYAESVDVLKIDLDAIKYLISTKPLDTVLNVLFGFKSLDLRSDRLQEIAQLIKALHPQMDYFRRVAVVMLRKKDLIYWSGRILSSQSELEAFKVISSEVRNQKPYSYEFFTQLAFVRSDLYVQCTDDEKFAFIRAIIALDKLEMFERILQLDANIINYVHEERDTNGEVIKSSMLDLCIKSNATKCSVCLLEIAPELIEPGTFARAIEAQNPEILDALINSNAQLDLLIEIVDHVDGKRSYTLIQYAFLMRCSRTLNHLVTKFGVVRVSTQIYAVWQTQDDILKHASGGEQLTPAMISFLVHVLGIDASTQITFGTMTCSLVVYLHHLRLIRK